MLAGIPHYFWQHGIPERSGIDRLAARIPAAAMVAGSEGAVRAQHCLGCGSRVGLNGPSVEKRDIAMRIRADYFLGL